MTLRTPESVEKLQKALHVKAKSSPSYRFYALYDKVHREDVLAHAFRISRHNGGTPGVDGQTFDQIESYGVDKWLGELADELRQGTYRSSAVKRAWMDKPDGGKRPLGIPTIRDRVVQTAMALILDPIFEADMQPEQYAYRKGRDALQAVEHVKELVGSGHREVVDLDLAGFFDSIPHAELMKSLARRISDRRVLRLIKEWLEAAVEETDHRGVRYRTTRNKDQGRGTSQGSPISSLLANVYMRRFVLGWKTMGFAANLKAVVVNYADDLVICGRTKAGDILAATRQVMRNLKLTINERKTRCVDYPTETFDFLGYTFGRFFSPRTGRPGNGVAPSRKAMKELRSKITKITARRRIGKQPDQIVAELNQCIIGWSNYFRLGWVSKAYRSIDHHSRYRLRWWLSRKHRVRQGVRQHFPAEFLHRDLGLVSLEARKFGCTWANT
jgi:group II intron reverse transcriptase/maturase